MRYFKHASVVALLLAGTVMTYGQTLEEVVEAYKKAAEVTKTNPLQGAKDFEAVVSMATKVGSSADEQRKQAEDACVTAYYNVAKKSIQAKKYAQAYPELMTTIDMAKKYKNTATQANAEKLLLTVELYAGVEAYQSNDTDAALTYFDKVIARNDNTAAQAMYYKALTYQKRKDETNMLATLNAALEKAEALNDAKWKENTQKRLGTFYFNKGVEAKQASKTAAALQAFQSALKFDAKNPSIFLQLAALNNAQSKWAEALNMANQGLPLATSDDDKFGFYYETGIALAGQGKATEACASFQKIKSGMYLESAKYQIEQELKCK